MKFRCGFVANSSSASSYVEPKNEIARFVLEHAGEIFAGITTQRVTIESISDDWNIDIVDGRLDVRQLEDEFGKEIPAWIQKVIDGGTIYYVSIDDEGADILSEFVEVHETL